MISLIFLTIFILYEMILNLPFELYHTFVIEEKHGFNKQTWKIFFTDKLKSLLLSAIIGYPVVSILIQIIKWVIYIL